MSATGAGATSDDLLARVRDVVGRTIPKNGRVLVVAKTDAALLWPRARAPRRSRKATTAAMRVSIPATARRRSRCSPPPDGAASRNYFLSERPEFTDSGDADERELTLEDVGWPDEFKRWCATTCGETAAAWGYRLTRNGSGSDA